MFAGVCVCEVGVLRFAVPLRSYFCLIRALAHASSLRVPLAHSFCRILAVPFFVVPPTVWSVRVSLRSGVAWPGRGA